jgi:2,3-bisphosphoglycerate-dependent phosphoglycerate mutase/probable phosphoglycerate mutase
MQGHLESELTELGLAQVRAAAPVLAGYEPVRLLSSDLSRAARTAEQVGEACGLPVKLDPRLRETHLGEWQGRTMDEVKADWPGLVPVWRSDPRWAPPGGESRVQVAARVIPLVDELEEELADDPPATVLLFAHGGLIAALSCALMGLPTENWMALAGPGNCRWTVLRRRGAGWRLASHNVGCESPA